MKHRLLFFVLSLAITCSLAFGEGTGLVLSGGGAKGAYEVGVWQAMKEVGIAANIAAMSGTSIGAINAALFASEDDTDKIKSVWTDSLEMIFVPNEDAINASIDKTISDITNIMAIYNNETNEIAQSAPHAKKDKLIRKAKNKAILSFISKAGMRALRKVNNEVFSSSMTEGYVDSNVLRTIINDTIPTNWPLSFPDVYATVIKKGGGGRKAFNLKTLKHEERVDILSATSAIPLAFDNVVIGGEVYVDGGWELMGGDNVPIGPIIEKHPEIKRIYVVYLNAEDDIDRRIDKSKYPDKEIIEIIPSENMGGLISGTLNFDADRAKKLIELGYKDAMKVLSKE